MKKKLTMCLSVALIAVMVISGTLAYLTSEDGDINTMTLGNVEIEQHEYQRAENEDGTLKTDTIDEQTSYVLEAFEQGKELLPIVGDPSTGEAGWDDTTVRMTLVDSYGSMQVFAGKNAVDKFVTVENTGKTDAYVRTLVAIEVGTANPDLIGTSYHSTWTPNEIGVVEIDGNNYLVLEYAYNGAEFSDGTWRHENGIVPAGDTTYPNLSQVYLKSVATNEDCEAIDGNNNGMLDILVLSQAVQAEGFADAQTALDTAFGKASEKAAEWFGDISVRVSAATAEDVEYGFENGGEVTLENDIEAENLEIAAGKKVEVELQGNTLTGNAINNKGEMNVADGNVMADYVKNEGNAEFTNVTITAGTDKDYASINKGEGTVAVYNNVEIVSAGGGVGVNGGAKAIFNSSSIYVDSASTSGRYVFYVAGEGSSVIINGGTFSWDKNDNQKRAYVYAEAGTTVTINGGTFGKASTRSGYTAGIMGEGTVIINGGTFGFDPTNWVADGYEAVKADGVWTVSAK